MNKFNSQQICNVKKQYTAYKPYIQAVVSRIRKNQFLQIWYLENSGKIAYFEGVACNSGNSTGTRLVYIKQATIDASTFGFLPTSPRVLLIR